MEFRSTFAGWAADRGTPLEIIDASLAHHVGTAVTRAYVRGDFLAARRSLFDDWARYCMGKIECRRADGMVICMIEWPDLTPEEQERWLAYAEIRMRKAVTWDEIGHARREFWLINIRTELQPRLAGEDKSMEEREAAMAEVERQDQEDSKRRESALQFICRDLGIPYTPGEIEAAFWALARRTYGLTGAPKPGNKKYPLRKRLRFAVAFMSAVKKCRNIADITEREKKALEMLHETKRWGHRQPKGMSTKRSVAEHAGPPERGPRAPTDPRHDLGQDHSLGM